MVLTEQQLFDYITCPALYDVKHNKNIPIGESISMTKLLEKVSKYFYVSLLNGKVPSSNELKKKWDSICQQYEQYVDAKKNIEGVGFIMKLLQWAADEQIMVADIDTKYNQVFRAGNGHVEIEGHIGTILALGNDRFELLVTDFSNRMPDQTLIDMKLKYSLDCLAFNQTYGKSVSGVRIRNVKNAKDFLTFRSQDDFNRLKQTVLNVSSCIEQKLYYPRESLLCANCNAKEYCKAWG